jgi:predicted secreted hydrolase
VGQPSRWRTNQLYAAHFALTDVARARFRFAQKVSRGALGLAGAEPDGLHVWLDDWSLTEGALHARGGGYELTLDLRPLMQPVLNGERGLSRKADEPAAASFYYSMPRIAVTGRLVRDAVPITVDGLAWLDREWGSGALGKQQQGWDWFALQLNDGSTLMFYSLRRSSGDRDPHSAGTWVDPDGATHALNSAAVRIDVGAHWSNAQGASYPAQWRLRVADLGLDLNIRPLLADQELRTRPRYWEGAVEVIGSRGDKPAAGRGYVELVGYGE